MTLLVVDAANVVGSRPDGWWRDRRGAAERLVAALSAAGEALAEWEVIVVLEGQARRACPDGAGPITLVRAAASGDDAVVAVVAERVEGTGAIQDGVTVVTSDRGLRRRVEALGAQVRGAGWLLSVLEGDAS